MSICEIHICPQIMTLDSFPVSDIQKYTIPLARMFCDAGFRHTHIDTLMFAVTISGGTCTLMLNEETRALFVEAGCVPTATSGSYWRILRVELGAGGANHSPSSIIGDLSGPLAEHGIPIFYCSTFGGERFLVRQRDLERAVDVLDQNLGKGSVLRDGQGKGKVSVAWPLVTEPVQEDSFLRVSTVEIPDLHIHSMQIPDEDIPLCAHALLNTFVFHPAPESLFVSVVHTLSELSLLLRTADLAAFPPNVLQSSGRIWRPIMISDGDLGFDTFGIVHRVTKPLIMEDISIMYLSVFTTDFCLVVEESLEHARVALTNAGVSVLQK